jgi:hypothetical protein
MHKMLKYNTMIVVTIIYQIEYYYLGLLFFDCIYIIDLFSMYNGRKRNATRFSF